MTTHRRGGRPSGGSARRKRQPPQRKRQRRSSSTSDEESSEGDSITRCICGETHNLGLMVQCDNCEVWQHCRCMGLEQPDIPDQYFCEQCKPEHHKLTKLPNGRNKRHYSTTTTPVQHTNALTHTTATTPTTTTPTTTTSTKTTTVPPAPKKRMTLNSREASMSLEDVLAAHNSPPPLPPPDPPVKEVEDVDFIKSSMKRKRELEIKLPETIDEKPEPPSSTVSSVGHEEIPAAMMESLEKFLLHQKILQKKETAKRGAKRRGNGKPQPRSRTSTPQPTHDGSPALCSDEETSTPNGDNLSAMLFEYFSPKARAASPPAKTRHPHARMSITEMNRRANQILEYISSIQVEMAINPSFIQHSVEQKPAEEVEEEEDDDNDSLSSASTIPLTTTTTATTEEDRENKLLWKLWIC
ncbi:unnamed protein product [Mucor hiemalis]